MTDALSIASRRGLQIRAWPKPREIPAVDLPWHNGSAPLSTRSLNRERHRGNTIFATRIITAKRPWRRFHTFVTASIGPVVKGRSLRMKKMGEKTDRRRDIQTSRMTVNIGPVAQQKSFPKKDVASPLCPLHQPPPQISWLERLVHLRPRPQCTFELAGRTTNGALALKLQEGG